MKQKIQLLCIMALLLTGCGNGQNIQETTNQITKPADDVVQETDGSLRFHLVDTASISIKSISGSEGVIITDSADVKEISDSLMLCKPYDPGDDYVAKYDYTLTFYDEAGIELVTIQAYENFVISYEGNTYYDESEQFNMAKVRNIYIEKMKSSFVCDNTSFSVNGKVYDLHDIDFSINAITEYSWFGFGDFPEPMVVLVCHINPNVEYCAVFDVEKMEYVFGTYGAPFAWESTISSLVYAFEDTVYNYWGDSIYQNSDSNYFINKLEYKDNALLITLASRQTEERIVVTRLNYHKSLDNDQRDDLNTSGESKLLAEFKADITHNGRKETLSLFKDETAGELASLEITDADGTIMWLEQAHTSHVGWNSVYLCEVEGEDYLLVFNPYQCTGIADFTYVLFYFNGPDTIKMVDSGCYSFSYGAEKGAEDAFDKEAFKAFATKVNTYLQSGYLLMSTENGVLRYSTEGNHLSTSEEYEIEKWRAEIMANLF